MKKFTIRRRKVARSPLATGPGLAWTWLYDVFVDGKEICHGTSPLASAEAFIRRHGRLIAGPYYTEKEWQHCVKADQHTAPASHSAG